MKAIREFLGYRIDGDNLITPFGRVYELAHVADTNGGRRRRMRFFGRRVVIYRVVMCIICRTTRISSALDVHHINADRHDCRICNLAIMCKAAHIAAHKLLREQGDGCEYRAYIAANRL